MALAADPINRFVRGTQLIKVKIVPFIHPICSWTISLFCKSDSNYPRSNESLISGCTSGLLTLSGNYQKGIKNKRAGAQANIPNPFITEYLS